MNADKRRSAEPNPHSALRTPHSAGFTLLEVLVATALVGIAAAALMSGLSGSLRNLSRLEGYEKAVLVGRAQMNRLLIEQTLKAGHFEGRWDENYRWEAEIRPWNPSGQVLPDSPEPPKMALVTLTVFWKGVGQEKHATFETCKYQGVSLPVRPLQ